MNRRPLLAMLGSGAATLSAGCLSGLGFTADSACPDPELEAERSYEKRDVERVLESWDRGVGIVTAPDEIERFDLNDGLNEGDEQWLAATEFDEHVVVGIQATSGGETSNSPLEVLGVEQAGETIHVYSCLAQVSDGDVAYQYARLLRVAYTGRTPTVGKHTHWREGERTTDETEL